MLNIYKVSGLPKIGASSGGYSYWTGGTVDYTNTVAFNNLLSAVNAKWQLIETNLSDDKVALYNNIDLDIICLQALTLYKDNPELYPLDFVGMVIAEMRYDGLFNNDSTDDQLRSDNLDKLLDLFISRLNEPLTGSYSSEFYEWWNTNVVPYNYNGNTDAENARFAAALTQAKLDLTESKIGATDEVTPDNVTVPNPDDFTSFADYVKACGPCFLYMFIPDNQTDVYNRIINWKRRKEYEETYTFIKNNCGGMYSDAAIKSLFAQGIVDYWHVTPKQKLQQVLANGGKIGDPSVVLTIVTIISTIISILTALLALIMDVYKITYKAADDANQYVPDDSDLTSLMTSSDKSNNSALSKLNLGGFGGIFVAGALLLAYLYNRDKQ